MSIARKVILDEIIENSHIENVHDVIFWALENYSISHRKMKGGTVANAIIERIKYAEDKNEAGLQNLELIDSLNL